MAKPPKCVLLVCLTGGQYGWGRWALIAVAGLIEPDLSRLRNGRLEVGRGWEPVPNGRTRLGVPNWVSKPSPGGPTRTTRWVDKDTHMGGTVIAFEVLESRYWVRAIFCLSRVRSHAMAMSHRLSCPFLLTVRGGSDIVPLRYDCLPLVMHGGDRQQPV